MKLNNKKILFISPSFFGYEKKIMDKMIQMGAIVDFFDERSISGKYEKVLLKIHPQLFYYKSIKYYREKLNKIKCNNYDFILVIKCEMMPVSIVKEIKKVFKDAIFSLYLYDSLSNIKGIRKKLDQFDRVLSFDLEDTKEYPNMIFRPLFFLDEYSKEYTKRDNYKFDIGFVGTIHSDRYRIIKKIKKIAVENRYKHFFYCYLQSRLVYYFYKITKKEFADSRVKDFNFDKITSQEIVNIIDEVKIILDIQHPNQTGLTMRTIEMTGMNKKIMTTNPTIKQYDFFNEKNIVVLDRENIVIPDDFFDTPYCPIPEAIYNKYSLENWILDVLGV